MADEINHPLHYNQHPSGVECITIIEPFSFNVGNAMKYLWRAGLKHNAIADIRKAQWYIQREIARLNASGDVWMTQVANELQCAFDALGAELAEALRSIDKKRGDAATGDEDKNLDDWIKECSKL